MAAATAFTGRHQEYVDFHHLTEVPASIAKWKHKQFSVETIENNLHQKLAQRCTTDKQKYNEILRMFKDQYRRSGKDVVNMTGINKDDFHQMLTILGLFATREQADAIFDKYDTNGSNNLSIHEFWVQCRPQDYRSLPGFDEKQHVDEMIMNRARKRMYIKESLLHIPVKPPVPPPTVYSLPTERLLVGIRDKIRQNSVVDMTLSADRTRRYLTKLFEYGDPDGQGYVDGPNLRMVLDHINYSLGEHYITAFCKAFPGPVEGTCDYRALAFAVYPRANSPVLTSGYGQGIGSRFSRPQSGTGYASGSMTARASSGMARRPRAMSRPTSRAAGAVAYNRSSTPRPPSTSRRASRPASRTYVANAAPVDIYS